MLKVDLSIGRARERFKLVSATAFLDQVATEIERQNLDHEADQDNKADPKIDGEERVLSFVVSDLES